MFWRRKREDDLERELRAHLEAEAEEQQGDRYAAQRAFGNLGQVKEDVREAWRWTWRERLGQDLRYALRTMRQNPGFTATAVLSLALGIGANTAIFSLIDALMLRWLPVRNPQELLQVKIRRGGPAPSESFPYPIIRALADQKDIFTGVTGFTAARLTVGSPGSVTLASSALVTGGYYEILGLNPSFGRLLTRDDDQPGAPAVAVIGDAYWEKQFSRSPEIVGQKLVLGGFPVTIVGVGPRGFDGVTVGATADITIPLAAWVQINPAANSMLTMGNNWLRVLARPRAGVSAAQAQAHLASVWPRLAQELIPPGAPPARRKAIMEATFEFSPGGTGYTYLRAMFGKPH